MDYSTIMVQADLDRRSDGLLRVTANLATLFKAHVIGIAACQPMLLSYGDGYMSGDVIEQDRAEIDRESEAAETRFRAALADSRASLEWRSAVGFIVLTDFVAHRRGRRTWLSAARSRRRWPRPRSMCGWASW